MNEPEYVDPRKIRPGPIRRDTLSPDMLEQIQAVFEVVGGYLGTTLEQFELGFMRDSDPESEVAVWCSITAAWLAYHDKFLDGEFLPDQDEKKLLAALIAISTGVEAVEQLNVPPETGERLLACYDELGEA